MIHLQTTSQARASSPREPLFHFAECAEKLGVTDAALKGLMRRFPNAPKPFRRGNTNVTGTGARHYYRMSEWRTWFKSTIQ